MVLNNVLLKKIEGFKQFVANMIPIAGNHTPSSDTTNGSSGTNMDYARSDHAHPKSNLYAESVHTHTINDLPSTIIDDTDIGDIIDTLNTDDIFTYSNKNVGQTGNIICLIGKLYRDDIEGKTIEFYNGNTLLGSSNTDTYGTALYDYTCTGSGKKEITTKHGNSVSTPYEVLDAIFYDPSTSNTGTWSPNYRVTPTYSNEGVHFTVAESGSQAIDLSVSSSKHPFDGTTSKCIEFDFKTANTIQLYLMENNGSTRKAIQVPSNSSDYKHYKWVYDATAHTVTPIVDGTTGTAVDVSSSNLATFGFSIVDSNGDIDCWLKEFKVYPI